MFIMLMQCCSLGSGHAVFGHFLLVIVFKKWGYQFGFVQPALVEDSRLPNAHAVTWMCTDSGAAWAEAR